MKMSALITPCTNQLKVFWDFFFYAETGTYEKSSWLDLFLAEFLIQLKDGADAKNLLSFCPIGGIVTLVGCELLCGVHCVTSSTCTQYLQLAKNDFSTRDCISNFQIYNTVNKPSDFPNAHEQNPLAVNINFSQISISSSVQSLQKYLLKGSAWRCLALLQSLGVEGLSCSRQLSGVLVWLYGELSGSGGVCHGPNPFLPLTINKPPIHQLFVNQIWIRKNIRCGNTTNGNIRTNNHSSRLRRKAIPKHSTPDKSKAKRQHLKNNVSKNQELSESSDSEKKSEELELLNRSFALKARLNPNDFDYFTQVVRNNDDLSGNTLYSPLRRPLQKKKPSVDDYITDRHQEILKSEISQFEFSEMAINLLYQLCKTESNGSDPEALHISMQCVNFSIKYLCTLQFESSPASRVHLTSSEATRLKALLTELLILSFDKVMNHLELFTKITHNGILPMLLRLLEDAIYKLQVRLQNGDDCNHLSNENNYAHKNKMEESEATDWIKYLFGISYSIVIFFYCLLRQHQSLDKIHEFTEQFKLFGDCHKGLLLRETICLILRVPTADENLPILLIRKLVDILNKLISEMKLIRCEIIHSASCPRTKHKVCRSKVTLMLQHHHDIFGTSFSHTGNMGLTPVCSISILYATLTSLLTDDLLMQCSSLCGKILRCMKRCGSCCCFSPHFLLQKIIRIIRSYRGLANLCFSILEQTLYSEMGAIRISSIDEKNACGICERYPTRDVSLNSSNSPHKDFLHDEGNKRSTLDSSENRVLWPFLSKYTTLLQTDNHFILHSTMSHLLRMSSQCKIFVKHDLFFCVLYPAFITAKSQYLSTSSEAPYFVTLSCLNAFSTLLSYPHFAEEFIQKGGLSSILDLMPLPEFSKQCCAILEIATAVEILHIKNNFKKSPNLQLPISLSPSDIENLSSLQMLFKSLDDITSKAFKYFKLKVNDSVFEKIVNLSNDEDCHWNFTDNNESANSEKMMSSECSDTILRKSQPININGPNRSHLSAIFEMQFSSFEQTMNHHLELLKNIWTFWKTCSALCLYCPILRKYLVRKKVFMDSYKMFKLLMHCICYVPCTLTENKLLIKILETIISINLSVSGCTMEKSKTTTLTLLHNFLLSEESKSLDVENVKSLCEMLIRVATIQPSNEQVMPPVNKSKLPPLIFSSSSDDEYMSSGDEDDSQMKPYMSEGSESYHSADEGYEADVEVGAVDPVTVDVDSDQVFKFTNTEEQLFNSVSGHLNSEQTNEFGHEYIEYKKGNTITHPELCSIVLSVLLDLIDRILKFEESSEVADTCTSAQLHTVVCSCLVKLSLLFHQDMSPSSSNGFISQIFSTPAVRILRRDNPHLEDLQRALLKLFYVLASKSITPLELKSYLKIFAAPNVSFNIVMEPLAKLLENVRPNVPDYIVYFPVTKYSQMRANPESVSLSTTIFSNRDIPSFPIPDLVKFLYFRHLNAAIRSSWTNMGLWCPIEGVNWGLWLQGCSVTMWMRIQDSNCPDKTADMFQYGSADSSDNSDGISDWHSAYSKDSKMGRRNSSAAEDPISEAPLPDAYAEIFHLFSVGHASLMIEFWVNVKNGNLIVQLTRPELEGNRLAGSAKIDNCIPLHRWNHLVINLRETTQKRKTCIEVTVYVNGCDSLVVMVPVAGIILHKCRPGYVLIGHSVSSDVHHRLWPQGSLYLSELTLFRAPVVNRFTALYMMGFGPNVQPFSFCRVGNQISNFGTLCIPEIISSGVDFNQIFDLSSENFRELQENLLLMFSAHSPNVINIYPQNSTSQSLFGSFVSSSSSKGGSASVPIAKFAHWIGLPLTSQHKGLSPSVYHLGGPQLLLYLFARVVEKSKSSEEQAAALNIFLQVSFSDTRLITILIQHQLLDMVQSVFASELCCIDRFFLKVMMDAACNSPITLDSYENLHLIIQPDVIIVRPDMLAFILKCWRELERATEKLKERMPRQSENTEGRERAEMEITNSVARMLLGEEDLGGLLGVFFSTTNAMLKDGNPYRDFNVYQLNHVNMVAHILNFCKERFLNSTFSPLNEILGYNLVELMRSLIGSPPHPYHVAQLTDFLILMHQASATFITYSSSTFFFMLTELTQQTGSVTDYQSLGLPVPRSFRRLTGRKYTKKKHSMYESNPVEPGIIQLRQLPPSERTASHLESDVNMQDVQAAECGLEVISTSPLENVPYNVNAPFPAGSPEQSKEQKGKINLRIRESFRRGSRKRLHSVASQLGSSNTAEAPAGEGSSSNVPPGFGATPSSSKELTTVRKPSDVTIESIPSTSKGITAGMFPSASRSVPTSSVPSTSKSAVAVQVESIQEEDVPSTSETVPAENIPSTSRDVIVGDVPSTSGDIPAENIPSTCSDKHVPAENVPSISSVPAEDVPSTNSDVVVGDAPSTSGDVPAENIPSTCSDEPVPAENVPITSSDVPAEHVLSTNSDVIVGDAPSTSGDVPAENIPSTCSDEPVPAENVPSTSSDVPAEDVLSTNSDVIVEDAPSTSGDVPAENIPSVCSDEHVLAENVPSTSSDVPAEDVPSICSDEPVLAENVPSTSSDVLAEDVPSTSDDVPVENVPSTSGDVPADGVPSTSCDIPVDNVPSACSDVPAENLPSTSGDVPSESIPSASGDVPADVPNKSDDVPADGAPSISNDTPVDNIPSESGDVPADNFSRTSAGESTKYVPITSGELPAENVTSTSGALPVEGILSSTSDIPTEDIPSSSSDDVHTENIPSSTSGILTEGVPSTSSRIPVEDIPSTSMGVPANDIPSTSTDTHLHDVPSTSTSAGDVPSSSKNVIAEEMTPSTSGTSTAMNSPCSVIASPVNLSNPEPFDIRTESPKASDDIVTEEISSPTRTRAPGESPRSRGRGSRGTPKSRRNEQTLTKDYVVIDSEDIDLQLIHSGASLPYQQLRSSVLLRNLRIGTTRGSSVCEGLLSLLRDTVSIMPDIYLSNVLTVVLHSDVLLVLSNHEEAAVRAGVMKVVAALVERCSAEEFKLLEQRYFFYHLANQIALYPASYDLVAACSALITGRPAVIEEQLEDESWIDITEKDMIKALPLMAVLPRTINDVSLLHNTTLLYKKVIRKCNVKTLNEICMCETVVKCLRNVGAIVNITFDGRQLILDDLRLLLSDIVSKSIILQSNLQMVMDLHNMLSYLELIERTRSHKHSQKCHVTSVLRDTQCYLIEFELDFMEKRLTESSKSARGFSYMSSGTSEASDQEGFCGSRQSTPQVQAKSPPKSESFFSGFQKKMSKSEMLNRYTQLINRACSFVMNRDFEFEISNHEMQIIERLFTLVASISSGSNKMVRMKWWSGSINYSSYQSILCEMFNWMVSALQPITVNISAIRIVYNNLPCIQKMIIPNDPSSQRKLAVYLTCLLDGLPEANDTNAELLKKYIMRWVMILMPPGQPIEPNSLVEEARHLLMQDAEKRDNMLIQAYPALLKSIFYKEGLAAKLADTAMTSTRATVDTQNTERKSFMEYIKRQQNVCIQNAHSWKTLVDQFAHEQGPYFVEESYPKSWELDPTEGPARVRVRLKRCHTTLERKFLNQPHWNKIARSQLPLPLNYLFDWVDTNTENGLVECLHLNETIIHMSKAIYVTAKGEQLGELLLSDRCIHFFAESSSEQVSSRAKGLFWSLENIVSVQTRRWQLGERAMEIFLSTGHAHFLAFETQKEMKSFLAALNNSYLPNRCHEDSLNYVMEQWRNGTLSNWEYLMHLNSLAGRTYNDLMQYPVLPFILSDYTSSILDLTNPDSYRELRRPMAIQDRDKESHFVNTYRNLKDTRRDTPGESSLFREPYHYGSHYSNSGTVLHFLVRLAPFTQLFLKYQDNNFDMPDRTFHSLQTTWRLSSSVSTSDVKELIPEFFYLPRFLCNYEGLNFGIRQCGIVVSDVELPRWAHNARHFINVHRQALESPYVRENLPHWIDLVFGFKQRGFPAIEAINVFHPATYFGVDLNTIEDPVERNAWGTMIRTYGQTPRQLFRQPHPHVMADLNHVPEAVLNVSDNIVGLRWGDYCGSPQQYTPKVVLKRRPSPRIQTLMPLPSGEVLGIPTQTTAVVNLKGKAMPFASHLVGSIGLVTWGHSDGIIRIKKNKDSPPESLYQVQKLDQLCVVAHGIGSTLGGVWLGLHSGCIVVMLPSAINSIPPTINFSRNPVYLIGHDAPIVAISVNVDFGVAVSASEDGVIIIWDIHSLTYIRTLPKINKPITHLCISNTMCDIAAVVHIKSNKSIQINPRPSTSRSDHTEEREISDSSSSPENVKGRHGRGRKLRTENKFRSKIIVHTVNGTGIGEMKVLEKVTSICYSNAPEGLSVNAIVVGLSTGGVRLYSSWDLKPINYFIPSDYCSPIVSICYSPDAHFLFIAGTDGYVMAWEASPSPEKTPVFHPVMNIPF